MQILPEHIRASLAQYNEHRQCTCLHCGYIGLMGVHTAEQKFSNGFGIAVGVAGMVVLVFAHYYASVKGQPAPSILWALGIGFGAAALTMVKRRVLACPNCNSGIAI